MRVGAILLAAMAVSFGSLPAFACSVRPPRLPPPWLSAAELGVWEQEQEERQQAMTRDWQVRRQNDAWSRASVVAIATLEATPVNRLKGPPGGREFVEVHGAVLRPTSWLKGGGGADAFRVGPTGYDCFLYPFWADFAAFENDVGAVFVVFATADVLAQETVLDVIPIGEILRDDPRSFLPPFN